MEALVRDQENGYVSGAGAERRLDLGSEEDSRPAVGLEQFQRFHAHQTGSEGGIFPCYR
jgi:hypothetical protein